MIAGLNSGMKRKRSALKRQRWFTRKSLNGSRPGRTNGSPYLLRRTMVLLRKGA